MNARKGAMEYTGIFKNIRIWKIVLIVLFVTTSCVSRKEIAYFQDIENLDATHNKQQALIEIQPNDLLSIVVSSTNMEAARPFNLLVETRPGDPNGLNSLNQNNYQQQPFLVSAEGTIDFPVIGKLEIEGLTLTQLNDKLINALKEYLKEPIVTIRLVNFQISVLGEVLRPGTYQVANERLSLPAALGLAGDLTIYGQRENILIIREVDGRKIHKFVNIADASFLYSEYYFLKQNDVIYVEPNSAQRQGSSFNRNSTVYVSIASLLITTAVLLFK